MTKSASATVSKTPLAMAARPVKSYSTSLKEGVIEKQLGHKIFKITFQIKHRIVGHFTISMMPMILTSIIQQEWQNHHTWWHRFQAVFQSNHKVG
jgi:hypothetical protein